MTDRRSCSPAAPRLRLLWTMALLCGGLLMGTPWRATAQGVNYLYFLYGTDGKYPYAGLIQGSDGKLYGTTYSGGSSNRGTVFRVNTDGTDFTVLHHFNGTTGASSYAGLIQGSDGKLYGTTESGGSSGNGTVFQITTDGLFNSLHSFTSAWGFYPYAPLRETSDGKLIGTTRNDSALDQGTLFQVNKLPVSLVVGARTDTTVGQPITFNAFIARRWDGQRLLGKPVTFKAGSFTLGTALSNSGSTGHAKLTVPIPDTLPAGTYTLTAEFDGNLAFLSGSATNTLVVFKADPTVYVGARSGVAGQVLSFGARMRNVKKGANYDIAGKTLTFKVGSTVLGTGVTDSVGYTTCTAAIPGHLTPGSYTITVEFDGDASYLAASGTNTLSLTP